MAVYRWSWVEVLMAARSVIKLGCLRVHCVGSEWEAPHIVATGAARPGHEQLWCVPVVGCCGWGTDDVNCRATGWTKL